ncbi:hypothetical protein ABFA25_10855 [Mycobacterium lepromatosis]|uniref:hypothetical protein n=1 Tax=Mycobacterium lepromatosis TaxID=480418 RepID=UPI000A495A8A|nr:hypothetical protein [Mycobacterium lepromatosis]
MTLSANGSPASRRCIWELRTHRNVFEAQNLSSGVIVALDDGYELHANQLLVATSQVSNADRPGS